MKTFGRNLAITGVLIGLLCAASSAGDSSKNAVVDVKVTVLPYAKVNFDPTSVVVSSTNPGTVTGTLTCNAPVTVTASISPDPYATLMVFPGTQTYTAGGVYSPSWTVTSNSPWPRTVNFIRDGDPVPQGIVVTITVAIQ